MQLPRTRGEINATELLFLLPRSPGKTDLHALTTGYLPTGDRRQKPEVAGDAATSASWREWKEMSA